MKRAIAVPSLHDHAARESEFAKVLRKPLQSKDIAECFRARLAPGVQVIGFDNPMSISMKCLG